jgi:hypothetical protein
MGEAQRSLLLNRRQTPLSISNWAWQQAFCFVSGYDLSRATAGLNGQGFRVCVKTPEFGKARGAHRRSLHYATPDFLWTLVALVHFMRPSSGKGAHAALSSAA